MGNDHGHKEKKLLVHGHSNGKDDLICGHGHKEKNLLVHGHDNGKDDYG